MNYSKRVKYISQIMPPIGISRYKYYEFTINNDNFSIINDNKEKLEFKIDEFKKLFTPEVEKWEDIIKSNIKVDKKIDKVESTVAKPIDTKVSTDIKDVKNK
jgi:hypothetical protein